MRKAFINTLCDLAEKDDRICLIVGDLGYSVVEQFAEKFPERFFNIGVAEQNMISVATGLCLSENKIVFVYSIANFPTFRCLEQIRNDICYHNCNVKIVAVGGGLTYGSAGYSHFATEDLAIMRALPRMIVSAPADACEVVNITKIAWMTSGPFYIRLGGNSKKCIHGYNFINFDVSLGDPIIYSEVGDIVLIGIGAILSEVLEAGELLKVKGYQCSILGLPFLKPLNERKLINILRNKKMVVTVEEHTKYGGLFSTIAEIIAGEKLDIKLYGVYLPEILDQIGNQEELRKFYKIDSMSIYQKVLSIL